MSLLLYSDQCGAEVSNVSTRDPIYVSSPNYELGLYHPNNLDCEWFFSDIVPGTYIVTIIEMLTEYWDTLSIGFGATVNDGSRGVLLRGWEFPSRILVPHLQMWIRFVSNNAAMFPGFVLKIERQSGTGKVLQTLHFETFSKCVFLFERTFLLIFFYISPHFLNIKTTF